MKLKRTKLSVPVLTALIAGLMLAIGATAGSLTPPGAVGSTMHSLANIYDSIASATFDSSGIVANQNGSLLGSLKYIENQIAWASGSNNIWSLTTGNVGIGTTSPTAKLELSGTASLSNALYLPNNGNVGIGTTAPITQLHIPGRIPAGATGTVATGGSPGSVFVQDHYAYVLNFQSGTLQIIDISNAASPVSLSSVSTANVGPNGVYVQGSYAYVVNYNNGSGGTLQIFDISNPVSPVSIGTVAANGPGGVYVQGRYAYVTNYGGNTFQIFDVSNPASPVRVGSVAVSNSPFSLYVQGRYAYVTTASGALKVINVSNPTSPVVIASVATGATPYNIYVQGRYAYVVNFTGSTLQVFDVSNPTAPLSVGSVATGTGPSSVYVQGRYAYVTTYGGGNTLQVFDVSDPTAPLSVGSVATGVAPKSLFVQGRYAYVTNYNANALQVFDMGGSYIQQMEAGGIETGTLFVSTNAQIANDLNMLGGAVIGRGLQVTGPVSFTSSVSVYNTLVFDPAGNVGIGTAAPTTTFQVIGNASVSGNFESGPGLVFQGLVFASRRPSFKFSKVLTGTQTGVASMVVQNIASGSGIPPINIFTAQTSPSNTNAYTSTLQGSYFYVEHLGKGDITGNGELVALGGQSLDEGNGGTVMTGIGIRGSGGVSGVGTAIVNAIGVEGKNSIVAGNASRSFALWASRPTVTAANLITNVGLVVDDMAGGTDNINILISSSSASLGPPSVSPPAGNWSIYNASARDNYFAGNIGIGTKTPSYMLEIGTPGDMNLASSGAAFRIGGIPVLSVKGTQNVWVGEGAGASIAAGGDGMNTAVGYNALNANTTGASNTALGAYSLSLNTTGEANVAVAGLSSNTSGTGNAAMGGLGANTIGSYNTAAGYGSLGANTSGNNNVAVGLWSLVTNQTGNTNTALGAAALRNTIGSDSIAVGASAGYSALGSGNIFLGRSAGYQETGSNTLWIDNQSTASSSAFIYGELDRDWLSIGASLSVSGRLYGVGLSATAAGDDYVCRVPSTGEIRFGATCTPSSIRFKTNVQDLTHGLDWVQKLRPVTFDWIHNNQPSLGLIAEEVASVSPLLALYQDGQIYSVNYQIMTAVLAKAIQEQQAMIDALKSGLASGSSHAFTPSGSFIGEIFASIVDAFKGMLGIEFGQGSVKADKVESKQLCVGGRCITEEEFIKVFGTATPEPMSAVNPTSAPSSAASGSMESVEPTPVTPPTDSSSGTQLPLVVTTPTPGTTPVEPIPTPTDSESTQ